MHDVALIRQKYEALKPFLDERVRRLWAGTEARVLGRGGIAAVAAATGLSRDTIRGGMQPAQGGGGKALAALAGARLRRVGGAQAVGGQGRDLAARLGSAGGSGHPRRSAIAPALDEQEHPQAGGGTASLRPPD